jgi:hypothetical protein
MDALFIILIFFISLAVSVIKSPAKALLNVYLIVLLLTPSELNYKLIEGLPSLSIGQAAIIPISFLALMTGKMILSLTDFFVMGFILTASVSDFINDGYQQAQNTTYFNICAIALPYIAGKLLIEKNQLDFLFAKRFVILSAICSLTMVYEFLTGNNLYVQIFWHIFHQVHTFGDYRLFFRRASGPFVHSIIACIVISTAFFLQSWLALSRPFKKTYFGVLQIALLYVVQGLGMITPLSRGPLLGVSCGLFDLSYALKKSMARILRVITLGIALLGVFYVYNSEYIIQTTTNDEYAQSAYYRVQLWDTYWDDLMQNLYLGVGKNNLEAKNSQGSIDNAYLHLALLHGIFCVLFFFAIVFRLAFRLLLKLRQQIPLPERQLVITFISLITMYLVSFSTVWISGEMMSILFLLFGWMEGYLVAKKRPQFVEAI